MDQKTLIRALSGDLTPTAPLWLMRQAGRYLPEYRHLRAQAGGFLDMVYNPDHACEITMQPIRRFQMHAAILFSDILVIPQAMGQGLRFEQGEGPRLDALPDLFDLSRLDETLSPVYETVSRVADCLKREDFTDTALIGFAGAPWTVAVYMMQGRGGDDFEAARLLAYRQPERFGLVIDAVTEATIHYLSRQIEAGAEALQIFDSWAGYAAPRQFEDFVIRPTERIVTALKARHPHIPLIGFPRGAGLNLPRYVHDTGIDAVGIDQHTPLIHVKQALPSTVLQGNLDPLALLTGGEALDQAVIQILEDLRDRPFIFNLGHGVIKETPPAHVERVVALVKSWKR